MIDATLINIRQNQDVALYKFQSDVGELSMLSILNNENLKVGDKVSLGFKSSDLIIAKNRLKECSLSNHIACRILQINAGEVLSVILLNASNKIEFESIISTDSKHRLDLKQNDEVFAYIKATSLFISEIYQ